jgi:peptidoglycan/LPS O-acetylase OafA/YrhL
VDLQINNGTIHLDVSTLQWLVYTVLPFLVDLVTKRFANGRIKAGLLAVFAVVTVILQEALQHDGDINLPSLLGKLVTALATAFVLHKYVWEPIRLTGDNGAILKAVPSGVGKVDPRKVVAADRLQRPAA